MRLAYVLHLDADELAAGHLSGHVEEVATGTRAPMNGYGDLHDFCVRTAAAVRKEPSTQRVDASE